MSAVSSVSHASLKRNLEAIDEKYQKLLDEDLGRVRAHVRTAVALTDARRRVLSAKLVQAVGARRVML